ncbi:MAG: rhamnan synthesis F family protein [Pseudomonadota bacterium]
MSLIIYGKVQEMSLVKLRVFKQAFSLLKRAYPGLTQDPDKLPYDFDRGVYLQLNPDLAIAGVDPSDHYLFHGRHEGRIYSVPVMDLCGNQEFKPDSETILVVSHEASRTGAPVLSLNIVQAFVKQYNVVVLLLGGGPLSDAFRLAGAAMMIASKLRGNPVLADMIVGQLCERFKFKFALVNSIESRLVLPALCNSYVPTISLVHEFASYTRPRVAFRDALFWSGEVVFSANVTMENAFAEYPDLGKRSAHILPQGRCLLPLSELSENELQAEHARIRRLIRPKGIAENSLIVLGAGFVQLRKGVDLFIECATRVVAAPDGNRCRFVWIGKGYDPENDVEYSVYLADQIRRAGLEAHVFFLNETIAIEAAYEEADLFLLSSRLDPLPNVAIDALAYGVPVLCFNKTTGIADFLIESGLRDHCVANYLDSADMAEKILALVSSQGLREDVADQCRKTSIAYFNMQEYVARLEALARSVCDRTQQEKADVQVILDSSLFRRDFSCHPHLQGQSIETEVRAYVRAWASGIDRRKPFPGFHPGVYKEQHGLEVQNADPFAEYVRAGQPEGPWNYPVIVAGNITEQDLPPCHRVALHLHVYYPELLPEIITRLAGNRICPDLFVSITDENALQLVVSDLKNYNGRVIDIQCVQNRGRDIGPFLTVFGPRLVANYDFVGHIHTKMSADVKDLTVGKTWYRFLLENLLSGERGSMADNILAKMNNNSSIGLVFPDDPYIVGMGANLAFSDVLAAHVGLNNLPEHFIFPIGTMFWARASALTPFVNLKLDWEDYPEEPLLYDGTLLHAIERLLSLSLTVNNFQAVTTNVIGLTR